VGKSTLAMLLKNEVESIGYRSRIINFASGVKSVAKVMGWDGVKDEKGRKLLQAIGEVGRQYDPHIWVKSIENFQLALCIQDGAKIVFVDDWRFPNEASFMKALPYTEVYTVRVDAPERECLKGTVAYNDCSETSLPDSYTPEGDLCYNITVDNRGSIDILNIASKNLIKYILDHCEKWE
jgi:hypothetical protein